MKQDLYLDLRLCNVDHNPLKLQFRAVLFWVAFNCYFYVLVWEEVPLEICLISWIGSCVSASDTLNSIGSIVDQTSDIHRLTEYQAKKSFAVDSRNLHCWNNYWIRYFRLAISFSFLDKVDSTHHFARFFIIITRESRVARINTFTLVGTN